ncbi:uncharacterized protein FIBRA_01410 [Fibroporia radiculosa]|uniref:F-box domain-containing protein n=1 Tax=Fibroporia radiculosa TaxID=599839 RepID=J4HTB1_9APHY|nr:uncharacterized protein FIBRA_01410 [Fibroporia radiculosa]CCL99392.1 predicted protein [Fibroporia radiculosa]
MAPHSILECDDILIEIFQYYHPKYLQGPGDEPELKVARNTLACSARVCKAFLPHALDKLWWRIDKISIALKVLPAFRAVYVKRSARGEKYTDDDEECIYVCRGSHFSLRHLSDTVFQHLQREIFPSELHRFCQYADKVRELHVSGEWRPEMQTLVLGQVAKLIDGPLFPCVESLVCAQRGVNAKLTGIFPFVISPTLLRLALHLAVPDERRISRQAFNNEEMFGRDLDGLSPLIAATCAQIQQVALVGGWCPFSMATLIDACNSAAPLVNYAPISTLLTPPNIIQLSDRTSWIQLDADVARPLPPLRRLELAGSVSIISKLFALCDLSMIQFLGLQFESKTEPQSLRACLSDIALKVSTSLQSLQIQATTTTLDLNITVERVIFPLRTMITLRSLRIYIQLPAKGQCQLGELHSIAQGWPALEELELHCGSLSRSLQTLFDIVSVCPRLRVLVLPEIKLFPLSELRVHGLSTHPLRIAGFDRGDVAKPDDDLRQVAVFLDSVFPELDVQNSMRSQRSYMKSLLIPTVPELKTVLNDILEEIGQLRRERERVHAI